MRLKSDLLLLLAAVIWGSTFVAQRLAAGHIGPFLFNGLRFLLGSLALLPFVLRARQPFPRPALPWMLLAGLLLVGGSSLQQAGIRTTSTANASFITGLYVVIIPLSLALLFKESITRLVWAAVGCSTLGGFLLSAGALSPFSIGDLLELLGAIFWAAHVILVGRKARQVDPIVFALGQFVVCGVLNLILGLIIEPETLAGLAGSWGAVLYGGILSVGIAYTLQVVGQRHAPPTDAALILSLETVTAAIFGYLILGETLTPLQMVGSALILAAVVLVQIPARRAPTPTPAG
ncbi:MAG TPA: DMT family transporter [Anaerolineaceae bacterium]|nr:DMT family transporter [Anaerolineaceae bacterium]HPN51279.1 DMT family transporter [Anaerolineaceae bacterium]